MNSIINSIANGSSESVRTISLVVGRTFNKAGNEKPVFRSVKVSSRATDLSGILADLSVRPVVKWSNLRDSHATYRITFADAMSGARASVLIAYFTGATLDMDEDDYNEHLAALGLSTNDNVADVRNATVTV